MLILAYHRVQPAPSDTLSVSTRNFERQLKWLLRTGWRPAPVGAIEPTGRRFAVTFDDGYRDNYEYAAPILGRLGVPAAFFITTGYVDANRPFPWRAMRIAPGDGTALPLQRDQIKELLGLGFELGSHTRTHPHLTELADGPVLDELGSSKRYLEDLTGRTCEFLAYPFGSLDERIAHLARQAGFRAAFVTPTGPGIPDQSFSRHRVGIYRHDTAITFALKTSAGYRRGLRRAIWAVKGRSAGRQ